MSALTKREQSALCCVQTLCEDRAKARLDARDTALATGKKMEAIQLDGEAQALLDAAETLGWLHHPRLTPAIAARAAK